MKRSEAIKKIDEWFHPDSWYHPNHETHDASELLDFIEEELKMQPPCVYLPRGRYTNLWEKEEEN